MYAAASGWYNDSYACPGSWMLKIDRFNFEIECPRCEFATRIQYRDARRRDVRLSDS